MTKHHWGKPDFTRNPVTGQWACAHCKANLPHNHKLCACQDKKSTNNGRAKT